MKLRVEAGVEKAKQQQSSVQEGWNEGSPPMPHVFRVWVLIPGLQAEQLVVAIAIWSWMSTAEYPGIQRADASP